MRKRDRILKSLGMIPKYQGELPSTGKEKRFLPDIPAASEACPTRLTLLYNDDLLGVADSDFERRGMHLSWFSLGGLVFLAGFLFLAALLLFFPLDHCGIFLLLP